MNEKLFELIDDLNLHQYVGMLIHDGMFNHIEGTTAKWKPEIQEWIDENLNYRFEMKIDKMYANHADCSLHVSLILDYDNDRDFVLFKLFWL